MLFSYVVNPRNPKILVRFLAGNENALLDRTYEIGDKIRDYNETDVLVGEWRNSRKEWIIYWVATLNGHIVGLDVKSDKLNKFDIANKYGLPNLRIPTKKSIIKGRIWKTFSRRENNGGTILSAL